MVDKLPLIDLLISVAFTSGFNTCGTIKVIAKVWAGPLHVTLLATTLIVPAAKPTLKVILFVNETPDQPLGKVQV